MIPVRFRTTYTVFLWTLCISSNNIRKELGLTQEQLAEKSGLYPTYVGSIERGEKNITLLNLEKVAAALDVEVLELFRYSEIKTKPSRKQHDVQEIVDFLLKLPDREILRMKNVISEIYKK